MEQMTEKSTQIQGLKGEKILFVERKPTAHPLFASLSAYEVGSKEKTPAEKFQMQMSDLEKVAMAGDLKAWQERFPLVTQSAKEASVDPAKDLNIRVQLKKLELTVMLQAAGKAQITAKHLEAKATQAQMKKDVDQSKKLFTQAQRLSRLAQELQNQLMAKTA